MATLILTVGLPYSGKTTWARGSGFPIVSPDAIRRALHGQRFAAEAEPYVWAIARTMVTALFGAGHQYVVLDAASVTAERRRAWLDPRWELSVVLLGTTSDVCIERARDVGDYEIIPIIERMAKEWEYPNEVPSFTDVLESSPVLLVDCKPCGVRMSWDGDKLYCPECHAVAKTTWRMHDR